VIDHIVLNVRDLAKSKAFYEPALKPLGYALKVEWLEGVGFGTDEGTDFFLAQRGEPSAPVHVALVSPDRATVDAFYADALEAGGADNGPPGLRRVYHEYYYGAYVLDPDGNNIEAVTHHPE
jgi:catechol 2,3-dioxygenase-like lactoylglutathione lyase family enzyme